MSGALEMSVTSFHKYIDENFLWKIIMQKTFMQKDGNYNW